MGWLAKLRGYWPWLGLMIGVLGAATMFFPHGPIASLRRSLFDTLEVYRPTEVIDGPDSPIQMVAITDETYRIFGNTIPREKLAEAIDNMVADGAKVIAIDLMFSDRDRAALIAGNVLHTVENKLPAADRAIIAATLAANDPDARLIHSLENRPVTAVFYSPLEGGSPGTENLPESWRLDARGCGRVRQPSSVTLSLKPFRDAIQWGGDALMHADDDGIVRRYYLMAHIGDCDECVYPSLGLSAAMNYLDMQSNIECTEDTFEPPKLFNFDRTDNEIPMDGDGTVAIDFRGGFSDSFKHVIPLHHLVETSGPNGEKIAPVFSKGAFQNKLVFVGLLSDLEDLVVTPNGRYSGFGVHALLSHSIIARHWLRRDHRVVVSELIAMIAIGLLVTLLFLVIESPVVPFVTWPLLPFIGFATSRYFLSRGYLVDGFFPGLFGSFAVLACLTARFFVERRRAEEEKRQREQSERELGRFLSPSVVDIALKKPELLLPAKKEITILFSDIRDFTTTAEGMTPEALVALLDGYLTGMTTIVFDHKGTLDKYIGDAVMALFGAPLEFPTHPEDACRAALAMFVALERMQAEWKAKSLPVLRIGIGINTGVVSVGRMGSSAKSEYTCIGDEVNFASRIEGLTKVYGVRILVGENTHDQAKSKFVFRDLGRVRVKGKTKAVRIYELLGERTTAEDPAWIRTFSGGMEKFLARDWDGADVAFADVVKVRGDDAPSAALLKWTKIFRVHPPEPDWDGTIERREK